MTFWTIANKQTGKMILGDRQIPLLFLLSKEAKDHILVLNH